MQNIIDLATANADFECRFRMLIANTKVTYQYYRNIVNDNYTSALIGVNRTLPKRLDSWVT